MKNILAENMLRFGVKNLTESQLNNVRLIMEQANIKQQLEVPDWISNLHDLLKEKSSNYQSAVSDALTELEKFKLQFNVCTYEQYIAMAMLSDIAREGKSQASAKSWGKDNVNAKGGGADGSGAGLRGKWKILGGVDVRKNYNAWLKQIGERSPEWWNSFTSKHISGATDVKLTPVGKPTALRAQKDGKVLTYGTWSPVSINNDEQGGLASNFQDVILFINNASVLDQFDQGGDFASVPNNIAGAATGQGLKYDDIYDGGQAEAAFVTNLRFEGGGGEQETETFVIPQKDGSVTANFPGESFIINKMELNPGVMAPAIKEIKTAIEQGAKIVSMTIESSASANEKTDPNPKTPGIDPYTGLPDGNAGPYTPKNANESRNAQLAFGRAQAMIKELQAAGITIQPTIKPIIQTANPPIKARYAKLTFVPTFEGKPVTVDISKKLFTTAGVSELGSGILQLIDVSF
tara:strand:- start:1142 stop:2530 length:1389 start_codon:yes stop_codon:yes gene_type:complete